MLRRIYLWNDLSALGHHEAARHVDEALSDIASVLTTDCSLIPVSFDAFDMWRTRVLERHRTASREVLLVGTRPTSAFRCHVASCSVHPRREIGEDGLSAACSLDADELSTSLKHMARNEVLVVDDIVATGATITAVCRSLLDAGCTSVTVECFIGYQAALGRVGNMLCRAGTIASDIVIQDVLGSDSTCVCASDIALSPYRERLARLFGGALETVASEIQAELGRQTYD